MAVSAPALTEALASIVGTDRLSSDREALAGLAVDGRVPRWAVWPITVEETSRLLALAFSEGLAVLPRGSGSCLGLGRPPARLDLVLDLSRLDRVIEHAPADQVVTVEAGVRLDGLSARLASHAQRLPLDPIGGARRSVGGVLATGDSGPLRYRFGTGRDLLLGVRFIQADGTVTWGGSRVVKSVSGYDVPKLLVGSLGTLGVIVEATLRLHPVPPANATWLLTFPSWERAGAFDAQVLGSTLEPDRVVLLNAGALARVGQANAPAGVAVSVGGVEEAVTNQAARLRDLAVDAGGKAWPSSPELWEALGAAIEGTIILRLAGEPRRLTAWVSEIERAATRLGLGPAVAGEVASGTARVALRGSPTGAGELSREILEPLRAALAPEGGSLVVERCPAEMKSTVDIWGPVSSEALAIMRRIKAEFDPGGTLNPERFVGGL